MIQVSSRMAKAGFTEMMMVVLRPERTERVGHAHVWRRTLQMEERAGINILRQFNRELTTVAKAG